MGLYDQNYYPGTCSKYLKNTFQIWVCPNLASEYSLKISLIISLKDGKLAKPVNNVKTPPFSSALWKRCRPLATKTTLGPPALGQFWTPSDRIFSRFPRKKVEFWPRGCQAI